MRSLVGKWPVASFVALTYAFSWTAWILAFTVVEGAALSAVLFVAGGFGPAVGAAALVRLEGESVRAWLRGLLRFRVAPRWYLLAVVIPVFVAGVHAAAFAVRGVALDPSVVVARLPVFLAGTVVTAIVGGGQEEFGWRGYMLPQLQARFGPLAASLAVGVVWAVWHLPLYVVPGAYNWGEPFATYAPVVAVYAVVFTWLFNRAGGALPVVVLLHAAGNNAGALIPVPREALPGLVTGSTYHAVQFAGVLLIVLVVLAMDGPDLAAGEGGGTSTVRERAASGREA